LGDWAIVYATHLSVILAMVYGIGFATLHSPFIVDLPVPNGDFPWLGQLNRGYQVGKT
jgi:hypothetical protein